MFTTIALNSVMYARNLKDADVYNIMPQERLAVSQENDSASGPLGP